MTFALYSVTADDNFCNYEYKINGLVGCTDDESLPNLLYKILNIDSLIYSSLCSLEYAINAEDEGTEYSGTYTVTQLFSGTYINECELKTHITSDLQTALPEHFI